MGNLAGPEQEQQHMTARHRLWIGRKKDGPCASPSGLTEFMGLNLLVDLSLHVS